MSEREPDQAPGAFRLEDGPAGIRVLVFDQPGGRVNLLTESALEELRVKLEALRQDPGVAGLLFASGKPGQFIAGADVAAIGAVREAGDAEAKAAFGQAVYGQIAQFPKPTAVAIEGACMGGGLELALACRYRFASDSRDTALALPEVRLGILPAFGGTTRLPRLIGLVSSLDLLLSGKSLDGRRARRVGLVDDVLPHEDFRLRAERAFAERLRTPPKPTRVPWQRWLVDRNPLGRAFVISQARKRVRHETRGHYPAPLRILDVLERSVGRPETEGFALEAEAAGDLLVHPVTRNLVALFFLSERAKKDPRTPQARVVAQAGVLGAGVMGGGIAALFARSGIRTRMKDVRHEAVTGGLAHAREQFERERRRGRASLADVERRMALLSGTLHYEGFRHLDIVVEAVVENLEIKRQVLRESAERAPRAILATNTSSLKLEDLAVSLPDAGRLVGLHFFNPVHRMPLIEIVVGESTSAEARDTAVQLTRRIGKTPVVVRSSPGFLVNRLLMPYLEEALRLFQAGVPMEELDRALIGFGMPMGPMELIDEVGLDVAAKVAHVLGEAFPSTEGRPNVLDSLVQAGRLGKKTGRGFYRYAKGAKQPDPAVYSLVSSPSRAAVQAGPEAWVERLILAMINEAARCLDERVVASGEDVDLAMILGTGFPPFRGGLMRYADVLGLSRVIDRLGALAVSEGPRFTPARLLVEKRDAKARLREDLSW
ncbi:MAG TPA: 3-hydroxyacyl-CoA dehydrogenase NAD-binding domain-containing protein [Candidatus Eisenbacteria bacterium]|nr:3-hydroxyacyl-CoA dehydrogenase NAD-binding domain-containing protein [Candidatus Eisenbacteria bacterium]